jgi:hypothetical protein
LLRKLLAPLAVIFAFGLPKFGQAAYRPEVASSFSERATKVKQAVEQMESTQNGSVSEPTVMQWGNWGNWNNWRDWGNWNNWNNWANWINF